MRNDYKDITIYNKLYNTTNKAKVYDFKNNFPNNIVGGGIYLMFEKGEIMNNQSRIVRVGKGNV